MVVAVKQPSPPPHTIITVRVRVGGVLLVLPDSSTVHSRKMLPLQQSSYLIPSRSPTMVVGLERCSAPPSECDLFHQRMHLCVSSGASCRTCVEQNISHHPPSVFNSPGVPPWVKPYKSKAFSSVRTQCASIAHTAPVSYKALHRRLQRAKNKMAKQQRLLREVNVPSGQFNMTHQELHDVVTVFDGGCHNNPPIRPPDGVQWCCILVSQLHREDESNPSVGLTFPRINNALPFLFLSFFAS